MLQATDKERQRVLDYMSSQADDEPVQFAQKVYSERVYSTTYDIWDVHTTQGRWWVITNPTNLYSQSQFPNMDLALTFHVGLSLRIPRSDRGTVNDLQVEPLVACWRAMEDAKAELDRAQEVEDFQAIGVRCRESLLTLIHVAQDCIEVAQGTERPKRSDFLAWSKLLADTLLPGPSGKDRRGLLKSLSEAAWGFTNWLTHAREAVFNDAQAAFDTTEHAMSLLTSALIRHVRGVPDRCPACGSSRLSPERAFDPDAPDDFYERPACQKCSWRGTPVRVTPEPPRETPAPPPKSECVFMTVPLRDSGRRPRRAEDE
jgi:hypothetical protein